MGKPAVPRDESLCSSIWQPRRLGNSGVGTPQPQVFAYVVFCDWEPSPSLSLMPLHSSLVSLAIRSVLEEELPGPPCGLWVDLLFLLNPVLCGRTFHTIVIDLSTDRAPGTRSGSFYHQHQAQHQAPSRHFCVFIEWMDN